MLYAFFFRYAFLFRILNFPYVINIKISPPFSSKLKNCFPVFLFFFSFEWFWCCWIQTSFRHNSTKFGLFAQSVSLYKTTFCVIIWIFTQLLPGGWFQCTIWCLKWLVKRKNQVEWKPLLKKQHFWVAALLKQGCDMIK